MKSKDLSNTEKRSRRSSKTDPLNLDFTSLREHKNSTVRFFARTGYTVWIIVMVVGLILAFIVSLFLV